MHRIATLSRLSTALALIILVCPALAAERTPTLAAERINVAVAANFANTARTLLTDFGDPRLNLVVGSSGKLFAQINNGAPFHVFLSADQEKPEALAADHQNASGQAEIFTYALGGLLLWVRQDSEHQFTRLSRAAFDDLNLQRIALANPKVAPYGRAALETLASLDAVQTTRRRWVQGENISQAFHFVASGNADSGFIAAVQLAPGLTGSFYEVPAAWHQPIRQDAILLRAGQQAPPAVAFYKYLKSEAARAIILAQGYQLPEPAEDA